MRKCLNLLSFCFLCMSDTRERINNKADFDFDTLTLTLYNGAEALCEQCVQVSVRACAFVRSWSYNSDQGYRGLACGAVHHVATTI